MVMRSSISQPVELLEPRHLLSAGLPFAAVEEVVEVDPSLVVDITPPRLVSQRVIGGPERVRSIELAFSEALHPGRAENTDNYTLNGKFDQGDYPFDYFVSKGYHSGYIDSEGFHTPNLPTFMAVWSAVYVEETFSVRLYFPGEFRLKHLRQIRVDSGTRGICDLAGNELDGNNSGKAGQPSVLDLNVQSAKVVKYIDADGDLVRIRVRGRGGQVVWRAPDDKTRRDSQRPLGDAIQIWIASRVDSNAVLSGTVTPSRRGGNGTTVIYSLNAWPEATDTFLQNPAFSVLNFESRSDEADTQQ